MPHIPPGSVSRVGPEAGVLLLKYNTSLELWRLGRGRRVYSTSLELWRLGRGRRVYSTSLELWRLGRGRRVLYTAHPWSCGG